MVGKIEVIPYIHGRYTWHIKTSVKESRHDVTISIDSEWSYLTKTAALSAARRWAKRLRIKELKNARD